MNKTAKKTSSPRYAAIENAVRALDTQSVAKAAPETVRTCSAAQLSAGCVTDNLNPHPRS